MARKRVVWASMLKLLSRETDTDKRKKTKEFIIRKTQIFIGSAARKNNTVSCPQFVKDHVEVPEGCWKMFNG